MVKSSRTLTFRHITYPLIILLCLFIFNSNAPTFADTEVIDDVAILIPISCTMSGVGVNSHNASVSNGTYRSEIGTTTLRVFCNDSNGFAIYAAGYTGNTVGETNSNKLVGVSNSNMTINTGTYTEGVTTSSAWAMKLSKVTNTSGQDDVAYNPNNLSILSDTNGSFESYHVVPLNYTKVASFSSATDTVLGSKLTTTYAAYIADDQVADTYSGKVKYTLVHPSTDVPNEPHECASNKICYFPNGGNLVVDSMEDQTISSSDTSAMLWPSNYQRSGYGFVGWSDAYDWVANVGSESNPDAHIYGPNETISFTAGQYEGTNKGLSLYAVWVPSSGIFQGWTGCSSMNIGEVKALTDLRDNDTYAIAKLADSKCWMIENLRLDNTATTGETNEALAQGYGTSTLYGNFIGLADPELTNPGSGTATANNIYYSGTPSGTATIDVGVNAYPALRIPRYYNVNTDNPADHMAAFSNSYNIYSLGNYYNWPAAVANTGYLDTLNNSVNTSICPANWHLPTGGKAYAANTSNQPNVTNNVSTFREYYYLGYTTMGSNTAAYQDTANSGNSYYSSSTTNTDGDTATKAFRKYPYNYLLSGYFTGSSAGNRGTSGDYWSSTINTYSQSFVLYINNAKVHPGTYNFSRHNGFVVRCVADN